METNEKILPGWLMLTVGVLAGLLLFVMVVDKSYSFGRHFVNEKPENTIAISAEGKVKAVPDMATVSLGVISSTTTSTEAQNQSSEKVNKIIEFVTKQGISTEDIVTTNFNIYPRYDYSNGQNKIIGYEANQTVTVKIRGVDKDSAQIGKILEGVTNNGANQVQGVSFGFDDPDNLRQEARKKAITKAKEKAQELADEAGIKLGRVISLSESGVYNPPMYSYEGLANGMGGGGDAKSIAPNVQTGSQDIVENITVIFEVK